MSVTMRNGGVLRQVVRSVAVDKDRTLLTLDCGHSQTRNRINPMDVPKRVICFPCGTAILEAAKVAAG